MSGETWVTKVGPMKKCFHTLENPKIIGTPILLGIGDTMGQEDI